MDGIDFTFIFFLNNAPFLPVSKKEEPKYIQF